jgi:excinuclease ABC subunit A
MTKQLSKEQISICGAREHNLKNISLTIPRNKFVVVTGVSGSGKSSLVFDTLYAEGYRKYLSCLSTHARQDLQKIARPDVDYIKGLSPVVAIEQHASGSAGPRSTVGTVTELADYARLLWASLAATYCPKDGGRVERRSLEDCLEKLFLEPSGSKVMILAFVARAKKSLLRKELVSLKQKGYNRVRLESELLLIDAIDWKQYGTGILLLEVVIDRIKLDASDRSRIADSLELAFREGGDKALALIQPPKKTNWKEVILSQHWSCDVCGTGYAPLTQKSFSSNSVEGACTECSGVGVKMNFIPELAISDPKKSIKDGAIKALRLGPRNLNIKHKAIFTQLSKQVPFGFDTPWEDLDTQTQELLLYGSGERTFTFKLARRKAFDAPFPGAITMLQDLFEGTSSETLRARLMAYQKSVPCPCCKGERLNALSQKAVFKGLRYPEFISKNVEEALSWVDHTASSASWARPIEDAFKNMRERLFFLKELGLSYLTLERSYNTLSGGESQRVRLATQLGLGMVGLLYVLDEPSIGLHPRDNKRLINALIELKKRGNSLVVVEHDEEIMRQADYLIEIGPAAGESGGAVMFEGSLPRCMKSKQSLTGHYLSGRSSIEKDYKDKDPVKKEVLCVNGATENNLKSISVSFPVGLLTVVCGVSGSGKSTLVLDILANAASRKLNKSKSIPGRHKSIKGLEFFEKVVCVDASPIGRSPRSNPATFVKLFDPLREIFSQCALSRVRGYKPGRFSFNVKGGRCERCQGDGAIKVSMQFLGDTFSECPSCQGKRYNRETLEVLYKGKSISDVLEMTVDEARLLFQAIPKIESKLTVLQDVGLGYLRLGQASNTLSGGEAQRIKLSLELSKRQQGKNLYILDEPTTGLHSEDIQKLLNLLLRLRDSGNTIIVIEHHLDMIKLADWLVELGPDGGNAGGELIFSGKPRELPACVDSLTGQCIDL